MLLKCRYNSFGIFNDAYKIGPARWKYFDLLFVHDGHIVIWPQEKRRQELTTGQSILIYPETEFYGYSIAEATHVSVQHFSIEHLQGLPDELKRIAGRKNGFEFFATHPDGQVERDIERLVNLRQKGQPGRVEEEMMSSVMFLVLMGIWRAQNATDVGRDDVFGELLSFMDRNVDRNISLEEMAKVCGLSASHFRAVFRKRFFQSPGNFFRRIRMNAAAKKLCETASPVKEIAIQSGFDTLPNFYRAFHGVYRISPAEYRRKNIPRG